MPRTTRRIHLVLLLVAAVSQMGLMQESNPQPASSATLKVFGVGLESRTFDQDALRGMTRTTLKVNEKDGVEAAYEGVLVSDILTSAGMTFGQTLRGPRLADYLIAEASDGYRVVYALPELDAAFSDRIVIIADQRDGKPLSERDGPFKIIVSDEKRHARWIRNVTSLAVQSAPRSE